MPNTIRMDVKNEKNINRKTIIDIMIKDLRIESKFISYVSTPYSSKSWLVSFKEEYDIEKIVGVNVTINEEVVEIKDYNKLERFYYISRHFYRFVHLLKLKTYQITCFILF